MASRNVRYESLNTASVQEFEKSYKREFGFTLEHRKIIVDDLRVRATGRVRCPVHSRTCMLL